MSLAKLPTGDELANVLDEYDDNLLAAMYVAYSSAST
jgi:hypothetical protein